MRGYQSNATYEHIKEIDGLTLVESWIVEDTQKDKSAFYDLNLPVGTWCGAIKVTNEKIWDEFVREGSVKGFSIEGYFAEKAERPLEPIAEDLSKEIEAGLELLEVKYAIVNEDVKKKANLESYTDYPEAATNNAKRALKWVEENGWGSCGEATGKKRAHQIANKEPLSRDTVARMASFNRHKQNKDVPYSEGCGGLMWDCWGGSAGINWAISKMKQLDK